MQTIQISPSSDIEPILASQQLQSELQDALVKTSAEDPNLDSMDDVIITSGTETQRRAPWMRPQMNYTRIHPRLFVLLGLLVTDVDYVKYGFRAREVEAVKAMEAERAISEREDKEGKCWGWDVRI